MYSGPAHRFSALIGQEEDALREHLPPHFDPLTTFADMPGMTVHSLADQLAFPAGTPIEDIIFQAHELVFRRFLLPSLQKMETCIDRMQTLDEQRWQAWLVDHQRALNEQFDRRLEERIAVTAGEIHASLDEFRQRIAGTAHAA
jgi:hypothetical protein